MIRAVVLISGRGSNLAALLSASLPVEFAAVISNRPDAEGLDHARRRGIPAVALDHRDHAERVAFDAELMRHIDAYRPNVVVLAGYMRILTGAFVAHYAGRLVNIHPSLLPSFPGLNTHRRALTEGVKIHGCTVHFVTDQVDHGPIIAQAAVPVLADDTEATLAQRVLAQEHRLYPLALRWLAEGRIEIVDGVARVSGEASQALLVPVAERHEDLSA